MFKKFTIGIISIIVVAFMIFYGIEKDGDIVKLLEERVRLGYNEIVVAGIVDDDGKVSFKHAGASQYPRCEDLIFEIGSITKVFTAHLAFILTKEGMISLEDDAQKYLDNISLPNAKGNTITIRNLLEHTSGIEDPSKQNNDIQGTSLDNFSTEDIDHYLKNFHIKNTPGEVVVYSNLGYVLVGIILEKASRRSYFDVLKEKILNPLEMTTTFLEVPKNLKHLQLSGSCNGDKVAPWAINHIPAFGALKSTAKDLMRYLKFFFYDRPVEDIVQKLLFPGKNIGDTGVIATPSCWTIDKRYGGEVFAAAGKTPGFSSFMGYSPKYRKGIVVLADSNSMGSLGSSYLNANFPKDKLYEEIRDYRYLPKFCGSYKFVEGEEICFSIIAGENCLVIIGEGEAPTKIYPMGDDHFFSKYLEGNQGVIEFIEEEGKMYVVDEHGSKFAEKIYGNDS